MKKIRNLLDKQAENPKKKIFLIAGIILLSLTLVYVIFGDIGNNVEKEDVQTASGIMLNENGKRDFFIETQKSGKFKNVSYLEKTAKVVSGEDITLVSQANGKIKKIYVKQGDKVANGQKIANLVDSIGNYGLNLERANLGVEGAEIEYSFQKINLRKSVDDAQIALEKIQSNLVDTMKLFEQTSNQSALVLSNSKTDLVNMRKILAQNLAQSELSLKSSKNIDEDTTFSLQIQKIKNNIATASIDVKNLKKSNIEQLKSFKDSSISTYISLENLMSDIIDFSDGILGVSDLNKRLNDKFEKFLGKKDYMQLAETKKLLKDFVEFKNNRFDSLDFDEESDFVLAEEGLESLQKYEDIFIIGDEGYSLAQKLLKEMSKVLDNSLVSIGSLDQKTIDRFKSQVNGFENVTQGKFSGYVSFKSQVRTFLNTYNDREFAADEKLKILQDEIKILQKSKSISKDDFQTLLTNNKINLEKIKIDQEKTIINLETAVKSNSINYEKTKINNAKVIADLKTSIKQAQLRYNNSKKVLNITLKKMNNSIKLSKNTTNQASKEFAKLSLKSPIFGVITDIYVDEGQDVNVGTPIAKVSNLKDTEAEVGLSGEEISFVKVGQKVVVDYSGKEINGKVKSISPVADNNLMYKTTISFSQKFKTIGGLVDIQIPVKTKQTLVPLNIVEVTGEGKGVLQTMSGGILTDYSIDLGKVWGNKIEVTSKLEKNIKVITTNLSNYDEVKFDLKVSASKTKKEDH